jgi:DNA-binding transcriptional LysR family regulator
MEFKHIRTFLALAEHLHFGHAAEQLGIAQPHVSRRIKQLEDDLGVALFLRNRRNVKLTEAGRVFLSEARRMLADAELAREHTRESALGRRGRLNLTLVASAMLGILPRTLQAFRSSNPDVHIAVRELDSASQLEALAAETTDVAFAHPPPRVSAAFGQIALERDPLVAVLPSTHRLAGAHCIALADLAEDPWVMFPRDSSTAIYDRIMATCLRAGFSPRVVQEAGPVTTRLGLVAAGFGVHLVHKAWEILRYPGTVYVPVEPTATIAHSCYWRKNDPNPILGAFLAVVREHRRPGGDAAETRVRVTQSRRRALTGSPTGP